MKCYLCGNKKLKVIRKKIRDAERDVLKCQRCSLVFLRPKKENLRKFYRNDYRKTSSPIINKEISSREIFNHYKNFQGPRLAMAKKYLGKNKRVLDIGCSAGHFLYAIKPYVKECVGIELNKKNVEFINKKLKIKAYDKPVEETDLKKKYFDAIFCLQTMEHMEDPVKFLKTVRQYLKDDGIIYIEVPNIMESTLSVLKVKEYENFYYHKPHLFYYSPETLGSLMKKAGYKGKIIPFQWYSFLNQMHWFLAKGPQKSMAEGIAEPKFIKDKNVSLKIRNEFNDLLKKTDKEWKGIIEKFLLSDQIVFVGKPR